MNGSKTQESTDLKTTEHPRDPFAVDFFGEKKSALPQEDIQTQVNQNKPLNGGEKQSVKTVKWFEKIPRLTRDELLFSERIEKLPDNLTKAAAHKIAETLTRYTFQTPKTVSCQMLSITEVDLQKTLGQFVKSPQTFLSLGCQTDNSTALLAFDTGFASSVIDLILSGKGDELKIPRKLSPIENTILEFLAGNILAGINDWVGENILCLQSVENDSEVIFEKSERGAEAVFRLDFAEFSGIITLLASRKFLSSIDKTKNPLLVKNSSKNKFGIFEKIAPQLNFRVQIGATNLEAENLVYLEPDDIVLIEKPLVRFQNAAFTGGATINLGSGENFNLIGKFLQSDILSDFGNELSFKLEEIKSAKIRRKQNFDRLDMENTETEKADESSDETGEEAKSNDENADSEEISQEAEDNTNALENVLVNLRVEIAGDKISLSELQKLRSGQIINLGCRPTDAVRIVTDTSDQPIALGELVDLEGQLGVRLTRVFI